MIAAFGYFLLNTLIFLVLTVRYVLFGTLRQLPRRLFVGLIVMPALLILQLVHWVGFLCDEIIFFAYRRVPIDRPVFITGIPRSGTTYLQRLLAEHEQITTMQMWECLFAPSITERYIYRGLGKLGQMLLRPFCRFVDRSPRYSKTSYHKDSESRLLRARGVLARISAIHELGLTKGEEDFATLLPIHSCFLLFLLFPESKFYWRLGYMGTRMPKWQQRIIMRFYYKMVQKHIFYHARRHSGCRYLSKNPSFTSWLDQIRDYFPDATIVLCSRAAQATMPSQLNSLKPAWQFLHGVDFPSAFEQRMVELFVNYYNILERSRHDKDVFLMPNQKLKSDLETVIIRMLAQLEIDLTDNFANALEQAAKQSRSHQSQTRVAQGGDQQRWTKMAHQFDQVIARTGL